MTPLDQYENVLFYREGYFYPISVRHRGDLDAQISIHVELNPGTTKVTDLLGQRIYWEASDAS